MAAPPGKTFSIAASDLDRAVMLTRLFIEALNARDLDGLATLVSEDVEFRNRLDGRDLHGRHGLEAVVHAAEQAHLRLARLDGEEVTALEGGTLIMVPVLEVIGSSEIRGHAIFEVRDGKIAAFELSSEHLRR
ncbi:MAG: nuclear transport factor 2 family protein [Solirubrobacteraceae bacterium]